MPKMSNPAYICAIWQYLGGTKVPKVKNIETRDFS